MVGFVRQVLLLRVRGRVLLHLLSHFDPSTIRLANHTVGSMALWVQWHGGFKRTVDSNARYVLQFRLDPDHPLIGSKVITSGKWYQEALASQHPTQY
jgi:hypothetical protein